MHAGAKKQTRAGAGTARSTSAGPRYLARGSNGAVYLVEGGERRHVTSPILLAPLTEAVGPIRQLTDEKLSSMPEGPSVHVLYSEQEPPSLLLGGRRRPIRGFPPVRALTKALVAKYPLGDALQIRTANGHHPPVTASPGFGAASRAGRNGSAGRAATARRWMADLAVTSGEVFLVRSSAGVMFVIERGRRRQVRSGLLAAALETMFDDHGTIADVDLEKHPIGDPVEVLECTGALPFVVIGGQRMHLRGLPSPYPVSADQVSLFAEGPAVDIAAANVPRSRLRRSVPPSLPERLLRSLRRRGLTRTLAIIQRRARGALRVSRSTQP
jgi:hypothetical protein